MIRHVVLSLLLLGALLTPATVLGQDAELRRTVQGIAAAWQRSDADRVASYGGRDGIDLELTSLRMNRLAPRRAAAVLRRLFADSEMVDVRTTSIQRTGGRPSRAFAELTWVLRAPGTTQSVRSRVFLALVRESGTWRLDQIRLLR
ncbi:MAG: hypothetical protein ACRELD_09245 [Longimicrobiales bacterium]